MYTSEKLRTAYAFVDRLRHEGVTEDELAFALEDPTTLQEIVTAFGANPLREGKAEITGRTPVTDAFEGVRIPNFLRRDGIEYLEELTSVTAQAIGDTRNVGSVLLREIKRVLAEHNLALRPDDQPRTDALRRLYDGVLDTPVRVAFYPDYSVIGFDKLKPGMLLRELVSHSGPALRRYTERVRDFTTISDYKYEPIFDQKALARINRRLDELGLFLRQQEA